MFPTRVGMNRSVKMVRENTVYVPHTCGDEPANIVRALAAETCSPHVWG